MSIWLVYFVRDGVPCMPDAWFFTEAEAIAHIAGRPGWETTPMYSASPMPR